MKITTHYKQVEKVVYKLTRDDMQQAAVAFVKSFPVYREPTIPYHWESRAGEDDGEIVMELHQVIVTNERTDDAEPEKYVDSVQE